MEFLLSEDIWVIGSGVVGQATAALLELVQIDATLVDVDEALIHELTRLGRRAVLRPEAESGCVIAFLCVPTPEDKLSGFNLDAVYASINSVLRIAGVKKIIFVLRSTVLPGTCSDMLNGFIKTNLQSGCEAELVYMPEFVRQAKWQEDAIEPRAIVLGSESKLALNRLKQLFSIFSDRIMTFNDPHDAEMIKIVHNAYNASKISFWNEMYRIGQVRAINMDLISKAVSITAEASWNSEYGIKGGAPFEGACLPKDLAAFIFHAEQSGIHPRILRAIRDVNESERQLREPVA